MDRRNGALRSQGVPVVAVVPIDNINGLRAEEESSRLSRKSGRGIKVIFCNYPELKWNSVTDCESWWYPEETVGKKIITE